MSWRSVATGWHSGTPVSLSFDLNDEKIWLCDREGYVSSLVPDYATQSLLPYSCSRAAYICGGLADEDEIWSISSRPSLLRLHASVR